jgi:hypothetical protein
VLTTPRCKKVSSYETYGQALELDRFFGTTPAMEKGYEFWNMECEEPVEVRVTYDSGQGIC